VEGEREGWNRYVTVDLRSLGASLDRLAARLPSFFEESWAEPRARLSLVVLAGPPARPVPPLEAYRRRFWEILAELRGRDAEAWPAGVPEDPADERWEFCFGGQPLFVFGLCPAYRRRRSRNVGPCLTLVFQTRAVFRGIGGETAAGRAAKATIRRRALAYDLVGTHEAMGPAEHSSTRKWRQYFLPDDDSDPGPRCPISREARA
jgi:FPC/CPF motif-containing protein YcgG